MSAYLNYVVLPDHSPVVEETVAEETPKPVKKAVSPKE